MPENPLQNLVTDPECLYYWSEYSPGNYLAAKNLMTKAISDLRSGNPLSKRMREHLANGLEVLANKENVDNNFAIAFGYKIHRSKRASQLKYLDFRDIYWSSAPALSLNKSIKADGTDGDLKKIAERIGISENTAAEYLRRLKSEYESMDVFGDFPPSCPPRSIY